LIFGAFHQGKAQKTTSKASRIKHVNMKHKWSIQIFRAHKVKDQGHSTSGPSIRRFLRLTSGEWKGKGFVTIT
jgi:hypothetical protein